MNNNLPIEIIRAILMRTEVDGQLAELTLVCRQFAAVLNSDTAFALEHIRRRFCISKETMQTLTSHLASDGERDDAVWDELSICLETLDNHVRQSRLPLAYKAALFALDSHAPMFGLYLYSIDATVRIVQCLDAQFRGNDINWHNTLKHLATAGHVSALDYVIINCARGLNKNSVLKALFRTCSAGQSDAVKRLMAVPISDGGVQSLDEALNKAVINKQLECVNVILNDPLGRVTQQGRDAVFILCAFKKRIAIPALLIQHGVSPQTLEEALFIAVSQFSTEFVAFLLVQSEIEPGLRNSACLEEAVVHDNASAVKLLLEDGRVSISANDYRALRRALRLRLTNQVGLLLEAAERLKDVEAVRIVNECLDQVGTTRFAQALRAQMQNHSNWINSSGSESGNG
ncbi:hypothetical protein HDU78_005502 [Chytriomyces hyalinus]|nr:hypothetical protein HDU78_005502 [Chytriomyces hyalinus]